jgi:hypothetical protein
MIRFSSLIARKSGEKRDSPITGWKMYPISSTTPSPRHHTWPRGETSAKTDVFLLPTAC